MGYIKGEGRNQGTLFPVVLDDFVPADHMCRVIDAFVETLVMSKLGFDRSQADARANGIPFDEERTSPWKEGWIETDVNLGAHGVETL